MCRDSDRHLHLHFLRTPLELLPRSPGCPAVGGVKLEVNELQARQDGSQAAVGLDQHETLPVRISSAETHCRQVTDRSAAVAPAAQLLSGHMPVTATRYV